MGDVRQLWIPGPAGRLEAAVRGAANPRAAAVVAHPHPLHGGTLHNPVIFHTDRALNRAGLLTLRFNFRGTGDSEGSHDEGRGEVGDLEAAARWLRGLSGDLPMLLVGFSFGSVCSIRLAERDPRIAGVVAIGMPVRKYAFDELRRLGRPLAVVQASDDEFGTPAEVRRALAGTEPAGRVLVVDGTSHLFPDRARDAAERVAEATEAMLP